MTKTIKACLGASSYLLFPAVAALCGSAPCVAQTSWLQNGANFVTPDILPQALGVALQQMGGRMTTSATAQVTLTGTVTDSSGTRAAQITVQSPGYLLYSEGVSRVLAFNGTKFVSNSGQPTTNDEKVIESFLAHFPDTIFLQFATGGSSRRLGGHFRTDNGLSKTYTGPYWTEFAFSPAVRPGLFQGQALQQSLFIAIDEKTSLISEIRVVTKTGTAAPSVTQTQFTSWIQQGSQWFPGKIIRLENGAQVLSFQTLIANTGLAVSTATFLP
jgi:hypothetical protein